MILWYGADQVVIRTSQHAGTLESPNEFIATVRKEKKRQETRTKQCEIVVRA